MSKDILVDASLRFAQKRKAGDHVPDKTYEQQKEIVSREIEKTNDMFCPDDYNLNSPDVILYPNLTNDTEPFSVIDEIVGHAGSNGGRLFITEDLIHAVDNCFGAYFDVTEQNDEGHQFNRQEETLKTASRIVASAWLFDSLDPRTVWSGYHDNPIYLASLQSGILPKGEGSAEGAIDVARFRVMGAIARNGFQDDRCYSTFQATYLAMFEAKLKSQDRDKLMNDPYFGLRFALVHACSDDDARDMLGRMHNVNRVIERYL